MNSSGEFNFNKSKENPIKDIFDGSNLDSSQGGRASRSHLRNSRNLKARLQSQGITGDLKE